MRKIKQLLTTILIIGLSYTVNGQSGQSIFDESFVHEIRITFDQTDYWDSLSIYYDDVLNNGADKKYLMATNVSIDGTDIDSVGVRQKGFFSNWGAFGSVKKPLKLDFKEFADHKFDGLKKLNMANGFKDPSMLRDVMAYRLFRDLGIKAPRTSYAKVFLNDQYWGLYILVEQIDSEFLEDNFTNPDGNLYKCIDNTSMIYQGNNWVNYEDEFELKTNEDINDNSLFVNLIAKINQTPVSNYKDSIDLVLNASNYLAILACDVLMYNWDSYYDHGRNFYVYQNPEDNKFNWIPWDYNLSFSESTTDIIIDYPDPIDIKPLVKKAQENSEYRMLYFQHVCNIILNKFNLTEYENFIDNTVALIRPDLQTDPNKFYSVSEFDDNVVSDITVWGGIFDPIEFFPGIKSFISGRMNTVLSQLTNHGFSCVLDVADLSNDEVWSVFPNPINDGVLTIKMTDFKELTYVTVLSITGEEVLKHVIVSDTATINFSDLSNGVYIIKGVQGSKVFTSRVIKK